MQQDKAEQIVEKIKELVKKGNITRIIIIKNNETIVNLPLNAGIIGLVIAPWAMLVATLVTIGTDCEIQLKTKDDKIIDISPEEDSKDQSKNQTQK